MRNQPSGSTGCTAATQNCLALAESKARVASASSAGTVIDVGGDSGAVDRERDCGGLDARCGRKDGGERVALRPEVAWEITRGDRERTSGAEDRRDREIRGS